MTRSGRYTAPSAEKSLLKLPVQGWAWEILRSNPAYQREAAAATPLPPTPRRRRGLTLVETSDSDAARKWGLCAFARPDLPYGETAVFWSPDVDRSVLPIAAHPTVDGFDRYDVVDFSKLGVSVTVLKLPSAQEYVLLTEGFLTIQFHVLSGTVLNGPVQITFQPGRLAVRKEELLTIDRFRAFRQNGRFDESLFPRHPRAERWMMVLRTLEFAPLDSEPNYLAMAGALFRSENVRHWTEENEWIRSRLRRVVTEARALVNGGYLNILAPDGADASSNVFRHHP